MNQEEYLQLGKVIRDSAAKTVLDVGFGSGKNVLWLDSLIEGGYIISIGSKISTDLLKGVDARLRNTWTFIDADSSSASAAESISHLLIGTRYEKEGRIVEKAGYGKPLDLLLLSGKCDSLGPLRDYLNFEPFVRPGGIIAWNSLNYPNVGAQYSEAVRETGWLHREICSETNHEIIRNGIGLMWKGV